MDDFNLKPEVKQLTKEEAIVLYNSGDWKKWSHSEIAAFQLIQDKMCVPFDVFHGAIEKALGRPVWTHEFALNHDGLLKELIGDVEAPTMQQIIELIPEDKRLIVVMDETTNSSRAREGDKQ